MKNNSEMARISQLLWQYCRMETEESQDMGPPEPLILPLPLLASRHRGGGTFRVPRVCRVSACRESEGEGKEQSSQGRESRSGRVNVANKGICSSRFSKKKRHQRSSLQNTERRPMKGRRGDGEQNSIPHLLTLQLFGGGGNAMALCKSTLGR